MPFAVSFLTSRSCLTQRTTHSKIKELCTHSTFEILCQPWASSKENAYKAICHTSAHKNMYILYINMQPHCQCQSNFSTNDHLKIYLLQKPFCVSFGTSPSLHALHPELLPAGFYHLQRSSTQHPQTQLYSHLQNLFPNTPFH